MTDFENNDSITDYAVPRQIVTGDQLPNMTLFVQ